MKSESIRTPSSCRLAAIMFTDIVGYSKLISQNEEQAVDLLLKNKYSQKESIEKFSGELRKDLGDGVMALFGTLGDAIKCATEIISKCRSANNLRIRIGVHLCDVTEREGDIYGKGINISSRIMQKAGANEIYISEAAYLSLSNRHSYKTEFRGRKRLKNIPEAIGVYELTPQGQSIDNCNNRQLLKTYNLATYVKKAAIAAISIPWIIHLAMIFPIMSPIA